MEARAELRYARISPTKVQIVLDLIRNKPVKEAEAILKNTPKAACEYLEKLLKSAVANATNNFNMDEDKLYVSLRSSSSQPWQTQPTISTWMRISSMCRSASQPPDRSSSVCVPEHRAEHTA